MNKKYANIKIIPIIILMGIVPLIVRMKKVSYPYFNFIWSSNNKTGYDIFAYYKSMTILFICGFLLIRLLYLYLKHRIDFKNKYIALLLVSGFLILLSYAFSEHQYVASFGFKDRYEGTYILLSYIVISLYILIEYQSVEEINSTLKYSMIFIAIIGFIGLGQYFKFDIFQQVWGKLILAPNDKVDDLVFKSQLGRVYMTLYNPNYVGSYFVLIGPLIANFFINTRRKWKEIIFFLIYIALVFSLAGSQSRGGFLGALLGLIVLSSLNMFFNKKIDNSRKRLKIILTMVTFLVIFLNHGNNINRVNTMFDDTDEKLAIQEIYTLDEKVYIKYNNQEYFIMEENNNFIIYNGILENYRNKKIILERKFIETPNWIDINPINMEDGDHTFIISIEDKIKLPFANTEDGMRYINRKAYYTELRKVPAIDVNKREGMGSGRVYIWSRSIPLLKDTIFIGNGADTYALLFPQTDYIGKFKGFGDYKKLSETIVDKPHNLYLQLGINIGIVSLIIYLAINILLIIDLINVLKKGKYSEKAIPFISIIIGYGITMLFNDSTVVVSTIYWSIIGLAMALIKLNQKHNSINFFLN